MDKIAVEIGKQVFAQVDGNMCKVCEPIMVGRINQICNPGVTRIVRYNVGVLIAGAVRLNYI